MWLLSRRGQFSHVYLPESDGVCLRLCPNKEECAGEGSSFTLGGSGALAEAITRLSFSVFQQITGSPSWKLPGVGAAFPALRWTDVADSR